MWGDSHAASLYRGLLKQSLESGFNLAQYNASGCPPVFDFDVDNRKNCKALNAFTLRKIIMKKPDIVILAAYWLLYDGKHDESKKPWGYLSAEKLSNTLSILKSLGIRKIIIVGQLPTYRQSQTKIGARVFVPKRTRRTYSGYVYESNSTDNRIRQVAANDNIDFISPIDVLCNESGCLVSTSTDVFKPLAWDYGHLTTDGSEYLIESCLRSHLIEFPTDQE
nr:SGNH hydrolase domain-containing protein [uncultured Thiodictyon sp.]